MKKSFPYFLFSFFFNCSATSAKYLWHSLINTHRNLFKCTIGTALNRCEPATVRRVSVSIQCAAMGKERIASNLCRSLARAKGKARGKS
jgi:hypothetical protein